MAQRCRRNRRASDPMSRQAGVLSGPTTPRHGMQSLLTSPWRSCDLFGNYFLRPGQPEMAHGPVHPRMSRRSREMGLCSCDLQRTIGHDGLVGRPSAMDARRADLHAP